MDTRLEICHANQWGTVCDDSPANNEVFDPEAITVICRSLGFDDGVQVPRLQVPNGASQAQIWLDNIDCSGNEATLSECSNNGFGVHNCQHSEDVGIRCF